MQGQDVNQADGRGVTPLGLAVGYNKLPVVKALLKAQADVHQADAKGSTPLHYAAGANLLHLSVSSSVRLLCDVLCGQPSTMLQARILLALLPCSCVNHK